MSLRLVGLLAILVPSQGFADTVSYKLLEEALEPPAVASEVSTRVKLPKASTVAALSSWRDLGSARHLRGLVCVDHVFVDDSTYEWHPANRTDVLQSSSMALRYLKKRANVIGVSLDWRETQSSYTVSGEKPIDDKDDAWTGAAVPRRSKQQSQFLAIDSCPVKECDQRLAILHVMKAGRSYAMPSVGYREGGVERVVMFMRYIEVQYYGEASPREGSGRDVTERPSAYAHEVLHVFGAQDMYRPEARRLVAEERYPDEVMLHGSRSLKGLNISDYTAYYIGWSDKEPEALPP